MPLSPSDDTQSQHEGSFGRGPDRLRVEELTRPDPSLMRYYALTSLAAGPLFPIALIPLACKYVTLRYRFDDSGIAMQWGVLFRREIYLTYRRIQDIHLSRNIVQRWFGLATLSVQTASGSATPEMSIEGILAAEPLRDHLYAKMRGTRSDADDDQSTTASQEDDALVLLREIRDALVRLAPANRQSSSEANDV
ncbi:MAG: PH domain-containing protein [Pirellulaceae bacterium]